MKKSPFQHGSTFIFPRIIFLLGILCFTIQSGRAQQTGSTAPVVSINGFSQAQIKAGSISYFVDTSGHSGIDRIRQITFGIPYQSFIRIFYKSPALHIFWLKFELSNLTDSARIIYLNCGKNINYTDLYFISDSRPVQQIQGGILHKFPSDISLLEQFTQTIRLELLPHQTGTVYLKLVQKTETFSYSGIYLYNETGLYQKLGERSFLHQHFIIFPLLFQGILICQLLYVLSQWLITKRREYLYYLFYLLVIAIYFLSMYEFSFQIRFFFARYPTLSIYLNKILLMLPYFFYFRFIRSFLDIPMNYPVMNKWIVRIEYFILAYLAFNLAFVIITFNLKLERELFTYILTMLFITSACFIIYLFNEKKTLIYFIVSGSFFVGLGNIIGLILDYLEGEKITHHFSDTLIFSQVGIILEISCFTAGLSYKSMRTEKEKIKSQENLIEQLKANELLQTKMQNIRNKIAQDLHDDIGSTLSSISILSNLVIKERDSNQTISSIKEIKNSSISLMEKMDDIVWSINPRNDSLENLLSRIKRFATTLFEAKNIDYEISIQENISDVKLPMEWRQHIYLILKEAINNLVKYSEATRALIGVNYQEEILEIYLVDNGRGFDSSKVYNGNGLLSMKNRADLMQAELIINSSASKGSQIALRIKIK
jgi:signal transduction histidine kinase